MNNLYDDEIVESVSKVNVDDSILKSTDDAVVEKVNPFKAFLRGIKNAIVDFFQSFKYNDMKLSGMLLCVPGVFLGFFIGFHQDIINKISFTIFERVTDPVTGIVDVVETIALPDMTAICFFALILLGTLNLFTGFQAMNKKNLGSVVSATIITVLITGIVAFYVYEIIYCWHLQDTGKIILAAGSGQTKISLTSTSFIMTMFSCGISVVCSIIGVILGFINYDRTYRKRDAR